CWICGSPPRLAGILRELAANGRGRRQVKAPKKILPVKGGARENRPVPPELRFDNQEAGAQCRRPANAEPKRLNVSSKRIPHHRRAYEDIGYQWLAHADQVERDDKKR